MSWFYLIIASLFEVGWPFGLKMATYSSNKIGWIFFATVAMILSGIFLFLAQKQIPMGTAYAIWTGIGTACTFLIGVVFFSDATGLLKFLGVFFIILGVVLLKISH